jgi:hypothetical protein
VDKRAGISQNKSRSGVTTEQGGPIIFVIGDLDRWLSNGRELPHVAGFTFIDVASLTADLLATSPPDIILSPLVARDYDAVEIARILGQLKFAGRYRVVTDGLPDPDLIMREVSNVAPDLDFAVVNMPMLRP